MENHWNGKLWYAYGTSITSASHGTYVPVVTELSGLRTVNRGIPGGSLTPDGYGKGDLARAVLTLEDGKAEADLITLEVLPNEGALIGDVFDTDELSFCGCLNRCLQYLQENTAAQIVLILMSLGTSQLPQQIHPRRGVPNLIFAETAARVAHLNGIPVIDAFGEAGFGRARLMSGPYLTDHIHQSELGGRNMGRFVWSKLKDIPLWEAPGAI